MPSILPRMKTSIVERTEFFYYLVTGTLATLVDWVAFAVAVDVLSLHYQISLGVGYLAGAITHYFANKIFTFKFQTKEVITQLSLYLVVMVASFALSMGVMAGLVMILAGNKIMLRIATTIIMLVPNYLLHKHISFSKRIFVQT